MMKKLHSLPLAPSQTKGFSILEQNGQKPSSWDHLFACAIIIAATVFPNLASAQSPTGFDLNNPTARCNNVLYFDYGSANDGPAYFTAANGAVLCQAGGFCKGHEEQCKACVEKYWHCDAPQPAEPEKQ